MANVADLRAAYEGRTDMASAWTSDRDDGAEMAWMVLRAILGVDLPERYDSAETLADELYFRAAPDAPLYTVTLGSGSRVSKIEVSL